MSRRRRLSRSLVACVVVLIGADRRSVGSHPAAPPGRWARTTPSSDRTGSPPPRWRRGSGPKTSSPYRAGVPLDQLASLYISEGNLAGVRGDIAFAQSILETRWFSFPAGGLLTPEQNNFAGIGACDSCATGMTFATVQLGVRAQMQQLRRYADPTSRSWNIGASPVAPLWTSPAAYDAMNRTHGWAPTWQSLSGTWASSLELRGQHQPALQLDVELRRPTGRERVVAVEWRRRRARVGAGGVVARRRTGSTCSCVGTDGGIWHNRSSYNVWLGWASLGAPPVGLTADAPAAVAAANGKIDVFARGTDNHLWRVVYDGTTPPHWEDLGGSISSGPSATYWAPDRVDVFARGPVAIWCTGSGSGPAGRAGRVSVGISRARRPRSPGHRTASTSSCVGATTSSGTDGGPGRVGSWASPRVGSSPPRRASPRGPPAVSTCSSREPTASSGTGTFDGGWRSYSPLGGRLTSAPGSVSWARGRIDVLARGTDGQAWHKNWS